MQLVTWLAVVGQKAERRRARAARRGFTPTDDVATWADAGGGGACCEAGGFDVAGDLATCDWPGLTKSAACVARRVSSMQL